MKLKIEGLSAGYDKDFVIKDLSLSVNQGEFLSLLGPSGCGKTTLMKAVAGILPAQGGRILLDGEDITSLPIHKRGTVIVFQDMRLVPPHDRGGKCGLSFKNAGSFPVRAAGTGQGSAGKSPDGRVPGPEARGAFRRTAAAGRPWPGPWRPGPGSCSWTSPFLPWTKISERICGILSFSYSGNSI